MIAHPGGAGSGTPIKIQPGSTMILYNLIKPSHDFYRNIISDSTGQVVLYDFMMEDFTFVDTAAKRIIFARSRQEQPGTFSTDTSETTLWLQPIRMHEVHYKFGVSFEMTFGDTLASVQTDRKGKLSTKTYAMQRGYFEDNMIEYIFGYVDWEPGKTYILDNFNKDTPKPSDPYEIQYAFDDIYEKKTCTVLHFVHGKKGTGFIWIDKATRQVLKQAGVYGSMRFVLAKC